MAVKSAYSNRFSRAGQRQELLSAWLRLTVAADDLAARQAACLFDTLRAAARERTAADAASGACWPGSLEERAGRCLSRLMGAYREAAEVYRHNRALFVSPHVRNIVEGLNAVLAARLKHYEETAAAADDGGYEAEKQAAMEKAAGSADDYLTERIRLFTENELPGDGGCCAAYRTAFLGRPKFNLGCALEALDHMLEAARAFCFDGLYDRYRDALLRCQNELAEADRRQTARDYYNSCENELAVLSSIIKIQINALELAVVHSNADPGEKGAAEEILSLLRESYQRFGRAAAELRARATGAETDITPDEAGGEWPASREAYAQYLTERLVPFQENAAKQAQAFPAETADIRAAFLTSLDKETGALFEQIRLDFFKAVYRFQRVVSEESLMAEEMIDVFVKMRGRWPDVGEPPPEAAAAAEIIRGVAETLDIKIESLRENTAAFTENNARKVNEFAAGKRDVAYDDRLRASDAALDKWMAEMPAAAADMAAFFEDCMRMALFAEHRDYYEKREGSFSAGIGRTLQAFKKETLLYEVSTYEEILIHSAPRLRDSGWEPAARTAEILDEALKTLEKLLKKNNIFVIRPAPHDPFNGREHEVLVAEKQEGFAKGEIIKLLGSGYRYKETVILRANVIAAR